MKSSFYADLIDNMGVRIDHTTDKSFQYVASAPLVTTTSRVELPPYDSLAMDEVKITSDTDGDELARLLESHPNFGHVSAVPVAVDTGVPLVEGYQPTHLTAEQKISTTTGSSDGRKRSGGDFDYNVFSSDEVRLYGGFELMKDVISIEYALAEPVLAYGNADQFLEGGKIYDYPLAVRIKQNEFASTRSRKTYPFLVAVAENDFGARVCRVFLSLERIATAGGYSADQLQVVQSSLYCGTVGQQDGQLHNWPTPERVGIVVNGKVDAKKVEMVCKRIVKEIPALQEYMDDVQAEAWSAEAAGHNLTTAQLEVLSALYAEVAA